MPLRRQSRVLLTTFILAMALLSWPREAIAQGDPATWEEIVHWFRGMDQGLAYGIDPAVPEPVAVEDVGAGWNAHAEISFPSNPPRVAVDASIWHDETENESVMATGDLSITLEFEIVQIQDPGVTVFQIPFYVEIDGAVTANPNGAHAQAHATFDLVSTEHLGVYFAELLAYSDSGLDSDSFSIDALAWQGWAELGEVFHVNLLAQAEASSLAPIVGDTAEASAELTIPAFRLKDGLIGATAWHWEDCYEILFCDGFMALGDPTPSEAMSWGRVKAMYDR